MGAHGYTRTLVGVIPYIMYLHLVTIITMITIMIRVTTVGGDYEMSCCSHSVWSTVGTPILWPLHQTATSSLWPDFPCIHHFLTKFTSCQRPPPRTSTSIWRPPPRGGYYLSAKGVAVKRRFHCTDESSLGYQQNYNVPQTYKHTFWNCFFLQIFIQQIIL